MSSTMKYFCCFVMYRGSRTNLVWLPKGQVWAIRIICINPRWLPDAILKNNILNNCHGKACNMSFKRFSGMQNPILMLFLHFDVPEEPNPRWPPDTILKN